MPTLITSANRGDIVEFIRSLPARIVGRVNDPEGVGRGLRSRIAWTFFSLVAKSFDTKGRGGQDEAGDSWQRNSPKYLAYGKGPKSSRRGSGRSPMNLLGGPAAHGGRLGRKTGTGELTKKQLQQWWQAYGQSLRQLMHRHQLGEAKSIAAAIAWKAVKRAGGGTLLERFGNRPDQVLVDHGTLRRSLQPGELIESAGPDANYRQNNGDQVYDEQVSRLVVGTRAAHADKHHHGKGVPKRRLWPEQLPESWQDEMTEQVDGGMDSIARLIERGDL